VIKSKININICFFYKNEYIVPGAIPGFPAAVGYNRVISLLQRIHFTVCHFTSSFINSCHRNITQTGVKHRHGYLESSAPYAKDGIVDHVLLQKSLESTLLISDIISIYNLEFKGVETMRARYNLRSIAYGVRTIVLFNDFLYSGVGWTGVYCTVLFSEKTNKNSLASSK
jgi:hypothetical protein